MTEIDVRGLSCPIPVIRTKEAMESKPADEIMVLVDSNVAKENVSRLAKSKKYVVQLQTISDTEYRLLLKPSR
jgi:tRNA 2-thiouridine synthesizing protein A